MASEAALAVAIVTSNIEGGSLSNLHLSNALIPAFDDLADANFSDEVTSANGRVELGALIVRFGGVLKVSGVLDSNSLANLRSRAGALLMGGLGNAHDCLVLSGRRGEAGRINMIESGNDGAVGRDRRDVKNAR